MRHARAEDSHPDGDAQRALTARGFEQAQRQALRMKHSELLPEIVISSPLVRARQTAETFCQTAKLPGPLIQSWLACGMNPESALRELAGLAEFNRVALVGHEPDLSQLLAHLCGCASPSIRMRKACIALLQLNASRRYGTLELLLPAKGGLGAD